MKKSLILLLVLSFHLSFSQNNAYPKFSWDRVPVAFHFGKKDALTHDEAKFISAHSNFIVLEKGHGLPQYKTTEIGVKEDAKKLKTINPNMKVIFYWNAFLDYPLYEAHNTYENHPEWWLKTQNNKLDLKNGHLKPYNLSNSEVRTGGLALLKRKWPMSLQMVFMDAFIQVAAPSNIKLWGKEKYDAIQQGLKDLVKETRDIICDDKLIVYNGVQSTPKRNTGNNFPDYTDAVMTEHFAVLNSTSKESMLKDIQEMEKVVK